MVFYLFIWSFCSVLLCIYIYSISYCFTCFHTVSWIYDSFFRYLFSFWKEVFTYSNKFLRISICVYRSQLVSCLSNCSSGWFHCLLPAYVSTVLRFLQLSTIWRSSYVRSKPLVMKRSRIISSNLGCME